MEALIPITFILTLGAVLISRSAIGAAFADRIRGGSTADREWRAEVEQLRLELDGVRQELADTQERVDFAERLLAQGRESGRLAGSE